MFLRISEKHILNLYMPTLCGLTAWTTYIIIKLDNEKISLWIIDFRFCEAEIDIFDHYHNVEVGLRRNELCLCLVVCIEKKKEMGGGTQIDELFIEVQVDANIRRDKKICKLAIQSECISCCRVMRSRWQGRKLPDCLQKRVSQYNILLIIRIHQRSDMT